VLNHDTGACSTASTCQVLDDAVMRLSLRQLDEVVSVTRHQEATVFMSELQDYIGSLLRENIAQAHDVVAELLE
jgi:uncharacterized protein YcaQ